MSKKSTSLKTFNNIDAIYIELPFLEKLVPRSCVTAAKIERWDDDLLEQVSWNTHLYLLSVEGGTVARVGGFAHWGENVGQALGRIGEKASTVRYALRINGRAIQIHKLPNGFENAADWIRSFTGAARKAIQDL